MHLPGTGRGILHPVRQDARTPRMRRALALALTALVLLPSVTLAADPPTLTTTVVDETGRLDGGHERIEELAGVLKAQRGITFYVVYINSLDGEDPADFIDRVAAENGLADGKNVALLVSLNDRKD